MGIVKLGFNAGDHEKIAQKIMGERYKPEFDEINPKMDCRKGFGHRYAAGHNEKMENEVLEEYGEDGREVFWIHLLADRYNDERINLAAEVIGKQLEEIKNGERQAPYYDKTYEREVLLPDDEVRSIEVQQQKQPEIRVEENPFYAVGFQLLKNCLSESMEPLILALREKKLEAINHFWLFYIKKEDIATLYLNVLYSITECYGVPDKLVSEVESQHKAKLEAVEWSPETDPSPRKERLQTIMKVELGLGAANIKHQEIVTALIADGMPDISLTEPLESIDPTVFQ